MVTESYIPDVLINHNQWIVWRKEERNGEVTKVPYSTQYDGCASSTNPRTWGSFKQAVTRYKRGGMDGIGFVFSEDDGLVFIDLDHCFDEDGRLTEISQEFIRELGTAPYIEVSQSGRGLHLILYGTIPRASKTEEVEFYYQKRYCAITGRCIQRGTFEDKAEALTFLFNKYKSPEKIQRPKRSPAREQLTFTEREVLEHAMSSPGSGDLFKAVYNGDTSRWYRTEKSGKRNIGHSEADFYLCCVLAFWTNRNEAMIDSIFRSSALMREKWERADYRTETIKRACDACLEDVSEYSERRRKERVDEFNNYMRGLAE